MKTQGLTKHDAINAMFSGYKVCHEKLCFKFLYFDEGQFLTPDKAAISVAGLPEMFNNGWFIYAIKPENIDLSYDPDHWYTLSGIVTGIPDNASMCQIAFKRSQILWLNSIHDKGISEKTHIAIKYTDNVIHFLVDSGINALLAELNINPLNKKAI